MIERHPFNFDADNQIILYIKGEVTVEKHFSKIIITSVSKTAITKSILKIMA